MKQMLMAVAALTLASGGAFAADLPPPQLPPPQAPAAYVPLAAPVFSWTGLYIGINGGYGFGSSTWNVAAGAGPGARNTNFNTSGFLAGATLGANYQMGSFVVGFETDGDWDDWNGSTACAAGLSCRTQSNWFATARGRAGWAWDRILFYGTAGGAFGSLNATYGGVTFTNGTQLGWTAGGGIEAALTPNWTAKIEYLYVDLGRESCAASFCGGAGPSTVSLTENVVRAGVNYKFGW